MVLRAGAIRGPWTRWDWLGVVAGFALPAVLIVFIVWAGATTDGYDAVRDTISELGVREGSYRWWFAVVNFVEAALLLLLAFFVYRRIPVGPMTLVALGVAAVAAVGVGAVPCTLEGAGSAAHCGSDGHAAFGLLAVIAIVGFQIAAAMTLRDPSWRWFRTTSWWFGIISLLVGVTVLVTNLNDSWGVSGLFERLFWAIGYGWAIVAVVAVVLRRSPPAPMPFDTGPLQRKILRSQSWRHGSFLFFAITDPARVKAWLATTAVDVADHDLGATVDPSLTIAFTHRGLARLSAGYAAAARSDEPFVQGMRARASLLGDVGESAPEHWDEPWQSGEIDVLAWIYGMAEPNVRAAVEELTAQQSAHGLRLLREQRTEQQMRDGFAVEHFGFRDGISQPWVEGLDPGRRGQAGHGAREPWGEWRPIARGEFVLGERDESADRSPVPVPEPLFRLGSFLVVRKLAQHVDEWRAFVDEASAEAGLSADDFEARVVGRHRDGRPVWQSDLRQVRDNDFSFDDDPFGYRCPLGAHIRRANPRESGGFSGAIANRRRMIRRGMTYGDDAGDDPWRRGLMFVAVVARIADQFEFVQGAWLNDGDRQGLGRDRDPIAGNGAALTTLVVHRPDAPPYICPEVPEVVRTRGGEYFFAPSVDGLRALSGS